MIFLVCFQGKVPGDDVTLSDLKLKPGTKIMMMGTREEEIVSTCTVMVMYHCFRYSKNCDSTNKYIVHVPGPSWVQSITI